MSGIGDKFKAFSKGDVADEPEVMDNAKEDASEPAVRRNNLGKYLHPKKNPGIGDTFKKQFGSRLDTVNSNPVEQGPDAPVVRTGAKNIGVQG